MGYCTVEQVKKICNTKRTDAQIESLIETASKRLNYDIQIRVYKEVITSISNVKLNSIDGTNTDFYTQNWPLGDYDNDFDVDDSDVHVYCEEGDVETELTVSSVTADDGKIVMASAPSSGCILKVTYCYLPKHVSLSHDLVTDATAYLTAFLCQAKVPAELTKSFTIDRLRIIKTADDVHIYWNLYQQTLDYIKNISGMMEVGKID